VAVELNRQGLSFELWESVCQSPVQSELEVAVQLCLELGELLCATIPRSLFDHDEYNRSIRTLCDQIYLGWALQVGLGHGRFVVG
jgi:hypothetical protein